MTAHPENVAGHGQLVTDLMAISDGRVVAKSGAEGLICLAVPERELGIAIRVIDGTFRTHAARRPSQRWSNSTSSTPPPVTPSWNAIHRRCATTTVVSSARSARSFNWKSRRRRMRRHVAVLRLGIRGTAEEEVEGRDGSTEE